MDFRNIFSGVQSDQVPTTRDQRGHRLEPVSLHSLPRWRTSAMERHKRD